jgi:hypothetical protein
MAHMHALFLTLVQLHVTLVLHVFPSSCNHHNGKRRSQTSSFLPRGKHRKERGRRRKKKEERERRESKPFQENIERENRENEESFGKEKRKRTRR